MTMIITQLKKFKEFTDTNVNGRALTVDLRRGQDSMAFILGARLA